MLIVEVTVDGHTEQRPDNPEPGILEHAVYVAPAQPEDPLIAAAREAILRGKTTGDGKPLVSAMEEIMEEDISAADRDRAWESIQEGLRSKGIV